MAAISSVVSPALLNRSSYKGLQVPEYHSGAESTSTNNNKPWRGMLYVPQPNEALDEEDIGAEGGRGLGKILRAPARLKTSLSWSIR
jgi:hypothetical protein